MNGDSSSSTTRSSAGPIKEKVTTERALEVRMSRLLHVDTKQRRVWICGLRVHHGLVGLGAAAVGAVLMLHDRKDFPWHV
jgi:hypothetical protein